MSSIEQNTTNHSTILNITYPDISEFYSNLTPFIIASICVASLLVILNLAIYIATILKTRKTINTAMFLQTTFLCSLYPLIALAALTTILLPQSWLICSTVMHLSFTFGAVVFHNMCFRYTNSEEGYLKAVGEDKTLDLQAAPLCCCCSFLPQFTPKKARLFAVKCLIWQMPLIQSIIMITLNIIYSIDPQMYQNVMLFSVPFLVTSILSGLWGINITVKMIGKLFPNHNLRLKMLSLQLILLLCKLQYVILDSSLNSIDFGGSYPIDNTILRRTIINLVILVEITLVSIMARIAYIKPCEEA